MRARLKVVHLLGRVGFVATFGFAGIPVSLAQSTDTIVLAPWITQGLSAPVDIAHAGDGSNRIFVVEQAGRIRVIREGVLLPTPYLDIRSRVRSGGEQGLLGLAFHPNYRSNGRLFIFYTRARANDSGGNELVIASLTSSSPASDTVNAASEQIVFTIPHPNFSNHNGGALRFGPDGFLYIGTGDGGSANDPGNNAQNRASLLGKILRISVDAAGSYGIPNDNPYIPGNLEGFRPEIFAYGLRNPWRFSFDRAEERGLLIGDVGQGSREEVNWLGPRDRGGVNFGWRGREGTLCTPGISVIECNLRSPTDPILEYGRDQGASITGGYRYRGAMQVPLAGRYIYADYVSGNVFSAAPDAMGKWQAARAASLANISTFGEDESGELFAATLSGNQLLRVLASDLDFDLDGIPNSLEASSETNPLIRDNDIFAATEKGARLFVRQQYRDFLGREADAGGINFWVPAIFREEVERSALAAAFINSGEFLQVSGAITRLYLGTFTRLPDFAGWQFFAREVISGRQNLAQVAAQFAISSEFVARYGQLSDPDFVRQLYRNILGREAEPEGVTFWTGELARLGRGGMLLAFTESAEYQRSNQATVFVFGAYAGMLRRVPDSEGLAFWAGEVGRGRAASLAALFIASQEYRSRFVAQ
jgi:hypothetical protein